MKAINIKWDTEDEDDMDFDGISNWLSDQTGFCNYGFKITKEKES